jgi:hypothetical protein
MYETIIVQDLCNDNLTEDEMVERLKEQISKNKYSKKILSDELFDAVLYEKYDVARALIKYGADVNNCIQTNFLEYLSVLDYALQNYPSVQQQNFIKYIKSKGAVNGYLASIDDETLLFTLIRENKYKHLFHHVDSEEKVIAALHIINKNDAYPCSDIFAYCILKGYTIAIDHLFTMYEDYMCPNSNSLTIYEEKVFLNDVLNDPMKYYKYFGITKEEFDCSYHLIEKVKTVIKLYTN